jgi:hypothetical protein
MLRTRIEHVFASQEIYDLELVKLTLDTSNLNEREALENGWLIDLGVWYQCRSVRLVVELYTRTPRLVPPRFGVEHVPYRPSACDEIYAAYVAHKDFGHEVALTDDKRSSYLVVSDNDIPVAFTKFVHYDCGLESQITAWNYHDPKLSLGKKIIDLEIGIARDLRLPHLYIGQGCEMGSVYKADLPGFEWWTGDEWSTDRKRYKELCARDSNVKTLSDLSSVFNY